MFNEARYERGVTYTGLYQAYFFFGLPAIGLGDRKTFLLCFLSLRLFLIQPL